MPRPGELCRVPETRVNPAKNEFRLLRTRGVVSRRGRDPANLALTGRKLPRIEELSPDMKKPRTGFGVCHLFQGGLRSNRGWNFPENAGPFALANLFCADIAVMHWRNCRKRFPDGK